MENNNLSIHVEHASQLIKVLKAELIEKCDSFETLASIKDKAEYWHRYFEEEIEIRIESLKIEVDKLGSQFNEKINKIESRLGVDYLKQITLSAKSQPSLVILHKLENICKCLNTIFKQSPCQLIHSEHIGRIYGPKTKDISQSVLDGNIDDFEYYLGQNKEEGVDLDKLLIDACNHSCISAYSHGHKNIAKILLWENANIDARGAVDGDTPLIKASRRDFVEIVKHLLYKSANVNAKNNEGQTALSKIAASGPGLLLRYSFNKSQMDIAKMLIDNGAWINEKDVNSRTALMRGIPASQYRNIDIAKLLMDHNADIHAKDSNGQTALMYACGHGYLDIVQMLIENNADVNMKDNKGQTALILASIYQHVNIVKYLVDNHADVNARDNNGESALMLVITHSHKRIHIVETLIAKNADVNIKDNNGRSPLMKACCYGPHHIQIVKTMVANHGDINTKDNKGKTALMEASKHGNIEIVKYLIENHANVNAKDNKGKTALMRASDFCGITEVVMVLIEHGANVSDENNDGQTVLMIASLNGQANTVKCLIENNANINARDKNGQTALMLASKRGHISSESVKVLIEHNADVNIKDNNGKTALMHATEGNYKDIIKILFDRHVCLYSEMDEIPFHSTDKISERKNNI